MDKEFLKDFKSDIIEFIYQLGIKAIYVVIALVVGYFVIQVLKRLADRIINKSRMELSVKSFVKSIVVVMLWAVLFFIIGLIIGIEASAFFTMFGAAGIAIGLALQGSLSNFAGGLLILIFKPFRTGDEVIIDGVQGYVESIDILYTRINNWRGEVISIPNGEVASMKVRNNSAEPHRRIEIELHFPLDVDFDRAREIVENIMQEHPLALKDKPFQLRFSKIENYYIRGSARCWSKTEEYWSVYWGAQELIKKALEKEGIELTVPTHKIYHAEKQQDKM